MKYLELRIPPALLMLLFGGLMRLTDWLLPTFRVEADWTDYASKVLFLLAVTVVVSGMVIIAICSDFQNREPGFGKRRLNQTFKETLVTEKSLERKGGALDWFGNVL